MLKHQKILMFSIADAQGRKQMGHFGDCGKMKIPSFPWEFIIFELRNQQILNVVLDFLLVVGFSSLCGASRPCTPIIICTNDVGRKSRRMPTKSLLKNMPQFNRFLRLYQKWAKMFPYSNFINILAPSTHVQFIAFIAEMTTSKNWCTFKKNK